MDPFSPFLGGAASGNAVGLEDALTALLLSFLLGQLLAWTYYFTHSGLSYSRSFVQSLILIAVVVSMVMSAVANSVVTALGLLGAMALIRFRNMLKDTRDMAFIFGALVAGMTAGAQRYAVAVIGTVFVCLCATYLYLTNFGSHQALNAFLQFRTKRDGELDPQVTDVLRRACSSYVLVAVRPEPASEDSVYAFQLHVRDPGRNGALVADLERLGMVRDVELSTQEPLLEV